MAVFVSISGGCSQLWVLGPLCLCLGVLVTLDYRSLLKNANWRRQKTIIVLVQKEFSYDVLVDGDSIRFKVV